MSVESRVDDDMQAAVERQQWRHVQRTVCRHGNIDATGRCSWTPGHKSTSVDEESIN